jgi:hypothetical protein
MGRTHPHTLCKVFSVSINKHDGNVNILWLFIIKFYISEVKYNKYTVELVGLED